MQKRFHHVAGTLLFVALLTLLAPLARAEERPAWEGVVKSQAQLDADRQLIDATRRITGGDLKKGAQRAIYLGWQAIGEDNSELAIRRFNQAWLLDPENPSVYWGFAISVHRRGDPLPAVERWFAEAEKRLPSEPRLLTDHGRVLDERGDAKRALAYFEKSLALDPRYVETHIGLSRVHAVLGNRELALRHDEAADRLKTSR